MRVVITGGAGSIGSRLATTILERGVLVDQQGQRHDVTELIIFDQSEPMIPYKDKRVDVVIGDMTDKVALADAVGLDVDTIFHLAGVVSGGAEADLQLGLDVNLDATRHLLDLAAATERKPKVIFASSFEVYGGPEARQVSDTTLATPLTSYGVQKLCGELLVGDYDRRGLIDGRALRIPSIAIRPGAANLAYSSFMSAVIREPIAGRETICPVPDDVPVTILSPRRLIEAIFTAHNVSSNQFGWPRSLTLPAVGVTVKEMLDALEELTGSPNARKLVKFETNDYIFSIIKNWPEQAASARSDKLGIKPDSSARDIVADFLAENAR